MPRPSSVASRSWLLSLGGALSGDTIALGADHAGFPLKEKIKQWLTEQGLQVDDKGTLCLDSVDYPDYARAVYDLALRRDLIRIDSSNYGDGSGLQLVQGSAPTTMSRAAMVK